MWWLYVAAGVLLAVVIFQAWDRRHSATRFASQEKGRVDEQSALHAKGREYAKRAGGSSISSAQE